ncbi:FERM and PDZ domain-containing protein 4-like [Uloborus diversus]|uniref:FERM and PDZ domain-containing protein 4-like n=1 Tax=Uloborus diversus TaxID=327109 RepID=UPI00240A658F|nr:FERM and PDZ domain-containing protein 4-like [Uloborus diversus]
MDTPEVGRYLTELNQRLRKGWTAHLSPEGRIYYMNHETRISSWLPPVESWDSGGSQLPFGWEEALDKDGKTYYINHTCKTTSYERPSVGEDEGQPPQPRLVQLIRDPQMGFGFVAGSEKPVIVRFVTEGGPNEQKLMPGDQILQINGEDVRKSPRERVIELIRSCKQTVTLLVCQPQTNNTTRKSALLTAAKKAKLKNNPSRVRFSEGVVINGSPLYSPTPMDSYVPFLPNVLKVFLENGQTKSFKYDSTTTVQDVLNSLFEKLSIQCRDHFSLATEHVKITRKNRLTVLDSSATLAKIASKPGAHHLRCVFRVTFMPRDAYDLLQKDPIAFEYLYVQCCNDVVQERFAPELKYELALRLAALQIQQHFMSSGTTPNKLTVKTVERECGLDRFVPVSLLETMKRKELRKLLGQYLKQGLQGLCAPGQRHPTPLQAKLHYLKVVSEMPSYGSKCFSTNMRDSNPEIAVLVSPRFGIGQIACLRNTSPLTLARIEELSDVKVTKEDEISSAVELFMKDPDKQSLNFSMEDQDAEEFLLMLRGYFRLLNQRELRVEWDAKSTQWHQETVPSFYSRHTVRESPWSYPPDPKEDSGYRTVDLAVPTPPYVPSLCEGRQMTRNASREKLATPSPTSVDFNMNETPPAPLDGGLGRRLSIPRTMIDERHPGIDYQSVISMELLEDSAGDVDVDVYEAKNDEVIRRVSEMNRILADVENYLCPKEDVHPSLKAADSLLLLAKNDRNDQERNRAPNEPEQPELPKEQEDEESDTDSTTPNDSPLHRSVPLRNSINNGHHPVLRRDSSFGLHSPDLLPDISSGNNILDILRHMQSENEEEIRLPFAEGTLYLDPDIIDLTMIPPPVTPDVDARAVSGDTPLGDPPTPFLDNGALHEEIERWIGVPGSVNITCHNGDLPGCGPETDADAFIRVQEDVDVSQRPSIDSLEAFIDSLTVPPPPLQQDSTAQPEDIYSQYVIPPPPRSSPSTEAQEEVIARFMAAAEDVKRLFEEEQPHDSRFKDLRQFWTEINHSATGALLNPLDALDADHSDFSSSSRLDSSGSSQLDALGFDKLLEENSGSKHLEVFGLLDSSNLDSGSHSGDSSSGYDTLTSSLASYSDTLSVDGMSSSPSFSNNSNESTPVFEQAPSSIRDLCIVPVPPRVRTSCVEDMTSPLSITSPSSTTSSDSSVVLLDPERPKLAGFSSVVLSQASGSCDDLLERDGSNHLLSPGPMVRSASWTNMVDMEDARESIPNRNAQKPPVLPGPFQQNRLRRSFNRGPLRGPVVTRSASHLTPRAPREDNNQSPPATNGFQQRGPFEQAQRDVSAMIGHLRRVLAQPDDSAGGVSADADKSAAAREALANESRRFVTSSKLFVKSAMDSSDTKMVANMAVCVALLNRMAAIGELAVLRSPAPPPLHLVASLRQVSEAFLLTLGAARGAVGRGIDAPEMALLMQKATSLATALTSLMRTLRAMATQ